MENNGMVIVPEGARKGIWLSYASIEEVSVKDGVVTVRTKYAEHRTRTQVQEVVLQMLECILRLQA